MFAAGAGFQACFWTFAHSGRPCPCCSSWTSCTSCWGRRWDLGRERGQTERSTWQAQSHAGDHWAEIPVQRRWVMNKSLRELHFLNSYTNQLQYVCHCDHDLEVCMHPKFVIVFANKNCKVTHWLCLGLQVSKRSRMAVGRAHTSAKAQQSPYTLDHISQTPRYHSPNMLSCSRSITSGEIQRDRLTVQQVHASSNVSVKAQDKFFLLSMVLQSCT